MRGRWFFPLFLVGSFDAWEGHGLSSVFCVSFCLFLLNCLNLFLTVLTRLGDTEPFGSLWGSRLSCLLQSSDIGFFSHKLLGFPFFLLDVFLGFKPLGLTISSLFRGPLCLFLWVWVSHISTPRTYPLSSPYIVAKKMQTVLSEKCTLEPKIKRNELKKTFVDYDTNKDGQFSWDELKSAFEYLKSKFPGIRTELAFHKCDKDENGYIDYGKEMDSLVAYAEKCGFTIT